MPLKTRSILITLVACVLIYATTGACLLRLALVRWVLPASASTASTSTWPLMRVADRKGNALLLRRYGEPKTGCIVFFPGQHGLIPRYEQQLFPAFVKQGMAVFAVAYPGQNSAPGKPELASIIQLAAKAVMAVQASCRSQRTVVYGRSLGAMVAAYAARDSHPAGLIIESAAPSLATAIRHRLAARWYLAPLGLLPISRFLEHNYSLADVLDDANPFPTILFQGTADHETPLRDLREIIFPANFELVEVPQGNHSDTYVRKSQAIAVAATRMMEEASRTQGAPGVRLPPFDGQVGKGNPIKAAPAQSASPG